MTLKVFIFNTLSSFIYTHRGNVLNLFDRIIETFMLYKQRHTLQSRTLTPRALTYRLLTSKSKKKNVSNSKPFSTLSSDISASVNTILKPELSVRNLNSHRSTAPGTFFLPKDKQKVRGQQKMHLGISFDVSLEVNGEQLQFTSNCDTIEALMEETINKLMAKGFKLRPFVFQSVEGGLSLDYYLTLPDSKTNVFQGKTIRLRPYFKVMQSAVDLRSFDLLQCIGSGGFSRVFLVRFKGDGQFYAMKVVSKSFISKHKKQQLIINQRNIMVEFSHPMHSKLHWAFQSSKSIIFVMDFYPGGELFGLIKRFRRMNENMARFYIIGVLLALQKLHDEGVAYRDMKPENILLDREGQLHLADFGLVKPGLKSDGSRAYSFCGSPEYMPPEIVAKKGHSLTADFYSLGALLYELVTGLPPFYSRNPEQIYQATLKQKMAYPSQLSPNLKHLLEGLLFKDDQKRLGSRFGVREILSHPWFGKFQVKQYLDRKCEAPVQFNRLQDLKIAGDEPKGEEALSALKEEQASRNEFRKMLPTFSYSEPLAEVFSSESRHSSRVKNINIFSKLRKKTQQNYLCWNSQSRLNNFL